MNPLTSPQQSLLLTLEEISRLPCRTAVTPQETLSNIVRLTAAAVRDRRLLGLSDGARPGDVGARRDGWVAPGKRRPGSHAGSTEGPRGTRRREPAAAVVEDADAPPALQVLPRSRGEDPYHSFLGVPVIDRGLVQGVLVVQTLEPRVFTQDEVRMLTTAGTQLAPIVGEARTLGQFVAPSHRKSVGARVESVVELGCRGHRACSGDLDPCGLGAPSRTTRSRMLERLPVDKLEARAVELGLHGRINYTYRRLQEYLKSTHTWGARHAGVLWARPVAYFSAEFGLHESLPIYSGGLGILAGDHIKSASDLGIPLVGVGLYYDQGYFRQRLDADGRQHEEYYEVNHRLLPMRPALDPTAQPVTVSIDTRSGTIAARVWRVTVGRNTLLLLDSDVEANRPEDRELSARLYGGDHRIRLRQELLLGVGGVRALAALDIMPGVIHLNEGHSAFAALELVRRRMETEGVDAHEAMRRVSAQVVFTTHTPVPAGHDRFPADMIEEHLGPLRDALGMDQSRLMSFGRVNTGDAGETFCMTVLALKLSHRANAVSSLHGQVSRAMWRSLYPGVAEERVPIGHITNGVHTPTWLAPAMHLVFDRHLGPDWSMRAGEPSTWDAIETLDDGELWETHQTLKTNLIAFARKRAVAAAERRGDSPDAIEHLKSALSLDALTIGFARRFATYKRANLILRDIERLASLVNDAQRPIQLLFAGKAHPLDGPGKEILQEISRLMRDPRFAGKLLFVEDYDIAVGRFLVQGVDVWLNTPRRPLEASGTSGQKVVFNGGLGNAGARRVVGGSPTTGLNGTRDRPGRDAYVGRRA